LSSLLLVASGLTASPDPASNGCQTKDQYSSQAGCMCLSPLIVTDPRSITKTLGTTSSQGGVTSNYGSGISCCPVQAGLSLCRNTGPSRYGSRPEL